MIKPVRLQLSRGKGFNLQLLSQAQNGLPAINVARPGRWGNPFIALDLYVQVNGSLAKLRGLSLFAADAFRMWLAGDLILSPEIDQLRPRRDWMMANLHTLARNNLGCWCGPMAACHADILLELANREVLV